ncbi:hypothetical protein BCR36DRAFT_305742 [Piromyces finnis]|uniref:Uncharacterized protein n=1 Tax=Piromyces finnis TaxID=1754191 RepID=A0A1Y1UXD6_9FUNG|nr:hypothetical protein BCR36DRAFT_305742 [Piromyces finnis]|eukprot:ORX42846.1 hypothetical protein BCR36DRAFT_305742 [Piromyces finnis]
MKTVTLLVFLGFSVLIYANSINFLKLLKRDVTFDGDTFKNSISEECLNEYKNSEYNECLPTITLDNFKGECLKIQNEKCQKFYEDPLKYYPICGNFPAFKELYQPNMIKSLLQGYDIYCQTNENGDLCPFSINVITKNDNIEILNEQCKSKKCTESLLKVYKEISKDQYTAYENSSFTSGNYSDQDLNELNHIISTLESKQCKSSHVSNDNETSDSISIKINNILLISLSLLLLIFYEF